MPGYAESLGIAEFLKQFGQHLLSNYEKQKQQEDDVRKALADKALAAINTGRVSFNPQQPIAPVTDTGVGSFFPTSPEGPVLEGQAPLAVAPPQPLSIAQQMEYLSNIRQGKAPTPEFVTAPEPPIEGKPSKISVDAEGKRTTTYDYASQERNRIQAERAKTIRAGFANQNEYLKAYGLAIRALGGDMNMISAEPDQRQEYINNFLEEYKKKKSEFNGDKKNPAKKDPLGLGL